MHRNSEFHFIKLATKWAGLFDEDDFPNGIKGLENMKYSFKQRARLGICSQSTQGKEWEDCSKDETLLGTEALLGAMSCCGPWL